MNSCKSVEQLAILGTVGVPGNYGGFETLADNLVRYHHSHSMPQQLTVYCSAKAYPEHPPQYLNAQLRYLPLQANGAQSIPYDIWSLLSACLRGTDAILLLGVSGALALPIVRLLSRARIITNIDGIEWKREKWRGLAKWVLRTSEKVAVRWSHIVVADNQAIADYVASQYGAQCQVIAYGGDHALATPPATELPFPLPDRYALALCRIEPENNVAMILEAFARLPDQALVFVGNWDNSEYGRALKARYRDCANITICDPVYQADRLRAIRDRAWLYVHGHSAGGTNPSLVEMMHFAIPVLAHGCNFNRYSTEHAARYFNSADELVQAVVSLDDKTAGDIGQQMAAIARQRYTWDSIGQAYFDLMTDLTR